MYKTHRHCKTYSAIVNMLRPTAVMADMRYTHCGRILGCDRTLIPKPSRLLIFSKASAITKQYVRARAGVCSLQFTNHLTDSRNLMRMLCL